MHSSPDRETYLRPSRCQDGKEPEKSSRLMYKSESEKERKKEREFATTRLFIKKGSFLLFMKRIKQSLYICMYVLCICRTLEERKELKNRISSVGGMYVLCICRTLEKKERS